MTRRRSRLIALSLAVVVVIGLLVVVFGLVRRPSTTYGSPPLTAKEAAHAVTEAQARLIPLGSSRAYVEAALGRSPENPSALSSVGVQIDPSCLYYNVEK